MLGDSPKLRAYFVWVPMLDGDTADAARLEASLYRDKRIAHFWDGDRLVSGQLARRLGLDKAWDVYLVFDRRARYKDAPSLWMHQLDGVKIAPWLDTLKLREKVDELIH